MSLHNERWVLYAKLALPYFLYPWQLVLFGLHLMSGSETDILRSVVFIASWYVLFHSIHIYKGMHEVWTYGEWTIATCMISFVFSESVLLSTTAAADDLSRIVAVVGALGCLLGCAIAAKIPSVLLQFLVLVGTPLVAIEYSLLAQQVKLPRPVCVNWLLTFLVGSEHGSALGLPRYAWLAYWCLILLFSMTPLVIVPPLQCSVPTAVARKWFHFIAIALFMPVTILSTKLMSLSYAIALCGLMAVECVRPNLPKPMQTFYLRFLDHGKDKENRVILSHMALIGGCAFPLWLSEGIGLDCNLLSLWGVLVLGIGDSLGAIVGSTWGSHKWGENRSLEGSAAMLISLSLCCSYSAEKSWIVPVLFTTLTEAFTSQIDNMTLPLVGATIIILRTDY
jgi:dolichol kinase